MKFVLSLNIIQDIGRRANIEAILGNKPLLWCWPSVPKSSGLYFPMIEQDGKWIELNQRFARGNGNRINGMDMDGDDSHHMA